MTIITVPKVGDGSDNSVIRPETEHLSYVVVEEHETEFVIEILGGE